MRGYILCEYDSVFMAMGATIEIVNARTNNPIKVNMADNVLRAHVKRGQIYKVTMRLSNGQGMGWYFVGLNFHAGYNYFSL